MTFVGRMHGLLIANRRARVLAAGIADLTPSHVSVLDVGCGDGAVAALLARARPDLAIAGVETLLRRGCRIPVTRYDGLHLPQDDQSVDVVLLIDVLHHTVAQEDLLREAARVARCCVVVKDHLCESGWQRWLLRGMDYVGNAHHGVNLPYLYRSRVEWLDILRAAHLRTEQWREALDLYPQPLHWALDRSLHFMAKLVPEGRITSAAVS